MENPASWGPAEKIVHDVLSQQRNILPEFRCGLSLERQITDALREAGLLREYNTPSPGSPDHEEGEGGNEQV